MKRIACAAIVLAIAAIATIAAQENPLIGSWKLNLARSDFAGQTMALKQVAPDEMEMTAEGQTFRFKLNGEKAPGMFGYTTSWTKTGENTWESVVTVNDKTVSTDTYTLSPDGKTLTLTSKGTKPNGEPFEEKVTYQRAESATTPTGTSGKMGAVGFAGEWKSMEFKTDSPGTLQFEANGEDGLTVKLVEWGSTASAKFDGKDYPASGPTLPAGFTVSMKRISPRSVEIAFKKDGKPVMTNLYTVSTDGKTLTAEERMTGSKRPTTIVFDRVQ